VAARDGFPVTDPRQPPDSPPSERATDERLRDEGSLVDQLAGLIADAQQWVARMAEEHQIATAAPECVNCPVCRLIAVLRGDHPELTDRAVDLASTVVTAMRTMFEQRPASGPDPAEPARVQRIALDRPDDEA
jgi:hypothetical protein